MALTITPLRRRVVGDRVHVEASVAFDNSYPTNGEDYTPADFGLIHLDLVSIDSQEHEAGFLVAVDNGAKKLVLIDEALAEEAAATNAAALTDLRVTAIGW